MKVIVIIPAYNEASVIGEVIEQTKPFVQEVIVIDDGSCDRTGEIARGRGAIVVSHSLNRGLGASIGTGLAAGLARGADILITLDADGQHDPAEIPNFITALGDGTDLLIGSRSLTNFVGMPWYRKIAQHIGNVVTYVLFGVYVTDSQSGYRAFSRHAAQVIEIRTNRMEVSSEIISEAIPMFCA